MDNSTKENPNVLEDLEEDGCTTSKFPKAADEDDDQSDDLEIGERVKDRDTERSQLFQKVLILRPAVMFGIAAGDIVTDTLTAKQHFSNGDVWFGGWTVFFIFLPGLFMIAKYINDWYQCKMDQCFITCRS